MHRIRRIVLPILAVAMSMGMPSVASAFAKAVLAKAPSCSKQYRHAHHGHCPTSKKTGKAANKHGPDYDYCLYPNVWGGTCQSFVPREKVLAKSIPIAEAYWGRVPCGGHFQVLFAEDPSPPTDLIGGSMVVAGWASWNGPAGPNTVAGDPATWASCIIGFPPSVWTPKLLGSDQAQLCGAVTHEIGHLLGYSHSTDPHSIMYPSGFKDNLPRACQNAVTPVPNPQAKVP